MTANRNDEALRETLEYAVRNARKAKANGFRGQFALNLETLEALHDMLTQRPEPAGRVEDTQVQAAVEAWDAAWRRGGKREDWMRAALEAAHAPQEGAE